MKGEMNKAVRSVLDLVFPRYCVGCGRALTGGEETLCATCLCALPRLRYGRADDNALLEYLQRGPSLEGAMSLLGYKRGGLTSRVVFDFKYHNHPETARHMGRMLAYELLPTGIFEGIDAIVPIPLSRQRRLRRGYNQAEMLARGVRDVMGLKIETMFVRRAASTDPQTMLTAEERQENLRGAFRLRGKAVADVRHILLLDDVITTGATILSCAATIKAGCDVKISVLSLARTV